VLPSRCVVVFRWRRVVVRVPSSSLSVVGSRAPKLKPAEVLQVTAGANRVKKKAKGLGGSKTKKTPKKKGSGSDDDAEEPESEESEEEDEAQDGTWPRAPLVWSLGAWGSRAPPSLPSRCPLRAFRCRAHDPSCVMACGCVCVAGAYNPIRNRVRDKLPLVDEMGRPVSVPAYYGMRLLRARMPLRVRGHIELPIHSKVRPPLRACVRVPPPPPFPPNPRCGRHGCCAESLVPIGAVCVVALSFVCRNRGGHR
jgi:hypothetical protein